MARQSNRTVRVASRPKMALLRCLGWRYSATREAWVHRFANGRRGRVYVRPAAGGPVQWRDDDLLYETVAVPAAPTALAAPVVVSVRLTNDDDVRAVRVDGRPPLPKRTVGERVSRSKSEAS